MTVTFSKLYLAKNIEALNMLAKEPLANEKRKSIKFESACRTLDKIYKSAQDNMIDQEKAYICLYRFLKLYEIINMKLKDPKFMNSRFEKQLTHGRKQFFELQEDLIRRYTNDKSQLSDTSIREPVTGDVKNKKFPDDSIDALALYSALNNPNYNILLVDARPKDDFDKSQIKIGELKGKLINIPDHLIKSGVTASMLKQELPPHEQNIWEQRDKFDIIVLFDWNSTYSNINATKLEKLLSSINEWDTNKNYPQKAIVLDGGYIEWYHKYPTLCTNPQEVINKEYTGLDELLDLDNIKYPDDKQAPTLEFTEPVPEIKEKSVNEQQTREELIGQTKDISLQTDKIMNQLMELDKKKWAFQNDDQKSGERNDIEKTIVNLEEQLTALSEKKNYIQEQFELYANFDPVKESLEAQKIKEILDMDKNEKEKISKREMVEQQRLNELAKARALKPKSMGEQRPPVTSGEQNMKVQPPSINRKTKPRDFYTPMSRLFDSQIVFNTEGKGLVGLKNIRNTCYQNTVIQCMRNVPSLTTLFCAGDFQKQVRRKPEAIIIETAYLFRFLWSDLHKVYNPSKFYEKVCSLEPNYRMGNHEDCMEFFLFLLNQLSEDCAYDIPKRDAMPPMEEAWFNQLGGKMSIFVQKFYHQLRVLQRCTICDTKSYKFEMESTFMLPVPEGDFKLQSLMEDYLKDDYIDDYLCAQCKKPVLNSKKITYSPKILVIVLKRYKQSVRNGNVSITKLEGRCFFPTQNFRFGEERYTLNSVAMHSGTMTSGHYTAAGLINGLWYEFNDESVNPLNIDAESIKTKACAFFYSKEE